MNTKLLNVFLLLLFLVSGTIFAEVIVEEYEPGQLLKRTSFDESSSLPWNLFTQAPAEADFSFDDDGILIEIIEPQGKDRERWDIEFRHRSLSIEEGHTYTVEFRVEANEDCIIYPKIGDQSDPYYEDWNFEQSWNYLSLEANRAITIRETFTAARTAENIEFSFSLASAPAGTIIKFYEISLYDSEFPGYPPKKRPANRDIRINQLGYIFNSPKIATLHAAETSSLNWWLENESGVVVDSGMTEVFGYDRDSAEHVHIIDFSDFNLEGRNYKLYAESEPIHGDNSLVESYPFVISSDIYDELMYDSLKYFYYNRSGIPIEMPYAENPEFERLLYRQIDLMRTIDIWGYDEIYTVDVTGGWYDTFDFAKFTDYGGISAWMLMNMYERLLYSDDAADVLGDGSLFIPESGDGVPDILNETRWQIEVLLSMQVPEGYDRAGMVFDGGLDDYFNTIYLPPNDIGRILHPPTTEATLIFAAVTAMASRLWEDYDPVFANELLKAAEKAWFAANENRDLFKPKDYFIGAPSFNKYDDYFYWAAAELFITTEDNYYQNFVQSSEYYLQVPSYLEAVGDTKVFGVFDRLNVEAFGTISLALVPNNLSLSDIELAKQNITSTADYYISVQEEQAYDPLIKQSEFYDRYYYIEGYPTGSNYYILNSSIIQAYAYEFTQNRKYIDSMIKSFDYILGRNPMETVYVTGYGSNYAQNPHHPLFYDDAVPHGILLGGPSSGPNDSIIKASGLLSKETAPQKMYIDHKDSWSTNQSLTKWNASLAWVSSYLALYARIGPCRIDGDVNGDGVIDSLDAILLGRYILGEIDDLPVISAADINMDGEINSLDYRILIELIFDN
ncbi:glycoside hydrolase family 9 protein [Natronospora cellulosivora (SeqCode)]